MKEGGELEEQGNRSMSKRRRKVGLGEEDEGESIRSSKKRGRIVEE